jgi:putative tryptophan/tyrosine transport system substrate-binding protein
LRAYVRWAEIFRKLVSINVDVIVTVTTPSTRAAKNVTQRIPIVMVAITDPVGQGFVQSLAWPGGNITGNTDATGLENIEKRLQLLKELLPAMSRVACLWLGKQLQSEEEG